jgi:hypothetical protein
MPYCSGCGFNNMEAVNFCTKCGIAMHSNAPQSQSQNTGHEESGAITWTEAMDAIVKKELNQLYFVIMGCLLISPFLMIFYAEGNWRQIYDELGQWGLYFVAFCTVLIIKLFQYLIKSKGINQGKPEYVLVALIISVAFALFNISEAQYALYNWANWVDEISTYVMIGTIFILWKKMKQTIT